MYIKKYNILFTSQPPEMASFWDGEAWKNLPALKVSRYRPESSTHQPDTQCKLLYDCDCIYGIFRVKDRNVRCVHEEFQSEVYKDSCVEFFVQPKDTGGYFNFEFNCGGAMLASYVTDPTRIGGRIREFTPLTPGDDVQVKRYSSLPSIVEPETAEPIVWFLGFSIPFAVLEKYAGKLTIDSGQVWRANFYKCGSETSMPHWASWTPLSELNFHLPANFGKIQFAPKSLSTD
jgi:hypothetical protein